MRWTSNKEHHAAWFENPSFLLILLHFKISLSLLNLQRICYAHSADSLRKSQIKNKIKWQDLSPTFLIPSRPRCYLFNLIHVHAASFWQGSLKFNPDYLSYFCFPSSHMGCLSCDWFSDGQSPRGQSWLCGTQHTNACIDFCCCREN